MLLGTSSAGLGAHRAWESRAATHLERTRGNKARGQVSASPFWNMAAIWTLLPPLAHRAQGHLVALVSGQSQQRVQELSAHRAHRHLVARVNGQARQRVREPVALALLNRQRAIRVSVKPLHQGQWQLEAQFKE